MTCLPSGGRYCSRMTVDSGNAPVLDLRMAKMATAVAGMRGRRGRGGNVNVNVSRSGSGEEGDRPSFPVCPGTTLRSAHSQTRCTAGSRSGPCACCLHAPFYRPGLDSGFWSARRTWPRQSYERISRGIETWPHFDCALSRGSVESTLAADMVDRTSSRDVGRTSLPRKDVM